MLNLAPMRGVRSLVFLGALRVGLQGLCSAATKIVVPRSKMQIAHSRSSGPGGQNVNKVNTKVELRFHVQTAEWLPAEVKARLVDDNANRVNKEGELIVTASESRSQASNMELAMAKIQEMVDLACIPPKVCRRGPAGRAAPRLLPSRVPALAGGNDTHAAALALCPPSSPPPISTALVFGRVAAARGEDGAHGGDQEATSGGQAAHRKGEGGPFSCRLLRWRGRSRRRQC